MRDMYLKSAAGCMLIAACSHAQADRAGRLVDDYQRAREEGKVSHVLDVDNDSFLLNKNDGFYTSGVRYSQRHTLPDTFGGTIVFGWRIGQDLYTANDIKLPPSEIGPPNHPYAGWLYGGIFRERHHLDGSHTKAGIDIGCLGPCAGGYWTQTNFHRLLHQPLPQGWSTQVKNEPGIVLYGQMAPVRWNLGSSVDITPDVHGRFGNIFTDLGASVLVRAGRLNILPDQPTWHGFMRLEARAVGYDATLQGGLFSSGNFYTADPKRYVGEAEIGMAWISGPYGARISIVRRSNEIVGLSNSIGSQNYGRVQLSYTPE